jgi:hypothetical protein
MIPYQYVAFQTTDSAGAITATLELVGTNTEYLLGEWAPQIAPRNTSGLGEPYLDVVEELPITITGDTAARALFNLAQLAQLLDQAGRWDAGENVERVELAVQMLGSANLVTATVLGSTNTESLFTIGPAYDNDVRQWILRDITVSVRRRGRWLGPRPTATAAYETNSPPTTTPNFAPFGQFPDNLNPTLIQPTWMHAQYTRYAPPTGITVYMAVARSGCFAVQDLSTRTKTGYTTVADAAQLPFQGTNILRYTPSSTARVECGDSGAVGTPGPRLWAVYAALRNNSATRTYYVSVGYDETLGQVIYTPPVAIDTSSTSPRMVFLGFIPIQYQLRNYTINCQASTISGSGTLDLSYAILLDMNDPCTTLVNDLSATTLTVRQIGLRAAEVLDEPTSVGGAAVGNSITSVINGSTRGNPSVQSLGTTLQAALFGVDDTYWVLRGTAFNTKATPIFRMGRRLAYLTPP